VRAWAWPAAVAVLAAILGLLAGRQCAPPPPPPAGPLPPGSVQVEHVHFEPAQPGEPRVVERVILSTVEAPVPEATVRRIAEIMAAEIAAANVAAGSEVRPPTGVPPAPTAGPTAPAPLPALTGRVTVRATKLEGTVAAGNRLAWAWTGTAGCDVRRGDGPWLPVVVDAPISADDSTAETTLHVPTVARWHGELRGGVSSADEVEAGLSLYGRGRVGGWAQYARDLQDQRQAVSLGFAVRLGR